MPQEVIEFGFDVAELSVQQKKVVQLLTQIYDLTQKLDGTKISPINITGFTELNKAVTEQNKILSEANKITAEYQKQQILAAKAAEANAKANTAVTKSENEVIKQIELETKASAALEKQAQRTAAAKKTSANSGDEAQNFEFNLATKDLALARNEYIKLGETFGYDSAQALKAAESVSILTQKVNQLAPAAAKNSNLIINNNADVAASNTGSTVNNGELAATQAQLQAQNELNAAKQQSTVVNTQATAASATYTTALEKEVAVLLEDEAALAANKAQQQLLNIEIAKAGGATAVQTQELITLRTEQYALNQSISDTRMNVKNLTKEFLSEQGSINELRARVNQLTQQYEALSAAEKRSNFGVNIKTQLNTLQPALLKAEGEIGKFQRNVGNYSGGISKALSGAFSFLKQAAYLIPGLGIAGILGAISDAVISLVKNIFSSQTAFEKNIQAQKDFAEQLTNTNKLIQEQSDLIKDLTQSDINYYQNQLKFVQAAGENQIQQFAIQKKLAESTKRQADDTVESLDASYSAQAKLKTQLQTIDEQKQKAVEGIAKADKALVEAQSESVKLNGAIEQSLAKAGKISGIKTVKEDLTKSLEALTSQFNAIKAQYDAGQSALQNQSNANAAVEAQALAELKYNNDERRKLILAETEIEVGLIEDRNKRVLSNEKSTLQQRIDALKATNAAQNKLIRARSNDVLNNPSSSANDIIIAQDKANAEIKKNNAQTQADIFKIREDFRLRDIAAQTQINKDRITLESNANKAIYDDDTKAFNIRIDAYQKYLNKQLELAKQDLENKLAQAGLSPLEISMIEEGNAFKIQSSKLTAKELEQIQKDYEAQIIGINLNGMRQITKDTKAELERQKQTIIDLRNDTQDIFEQGIAATASDINTNFLNKQTSLIEQYLTGGLTKEDLSRKIRNSINDQQKEVLKAFIDSSEKQLKELPVLSEGYSTVAEAIAKARRELAGLNAETGDNKLLDLADDLQSVAEITSNIVDTFTTLSNISFDNQKTELEEIAAQEEKNYELQQKNIENSMASDEERAHQLQILDSGHAARQEEIARRQRVVDNKKAEFDKQLAILNIVVGTAEAVVKALATGGPFAIPLAISVGALGAAQLAAAIATKVPHYASGLSDAKEDHIGLVGEAGKEKVQRPGFKDVIASQAQLMYLPKHSKVIPLKTDINAMANRSLNGLVVSMPAAVKDESWEQTKWLANKIIKNQRKVVVRGGGKYNLSDAMYIAKNIKHTA